jgi:hypothetical protein
MAIDHGLGDLANHEEVAKTRAVPLHFAQAPNMKILFYHHGFRVTVNNFTIFT